MAPRGAKCHECGTVGVTVRGLGLCAKCAERTTIGSDRQRSSRRSTQEEPVQDIPEPTVKDDKKALSRSGATRRRQRGESSTMTTSGAAMDDQGRFICLFQTLDRDLFLVHTEKMRDGSEVTGEEGDRTAAKISKALTNIQRGIPARCPYVTGDFDMCQSHVSDCAERQETADTSAPAQPIPEPSSARGRTTRRRGSGSGDSSRPAKVARTQASSEGTTDSVDKDEKQLLHCPFETSDLDRFIEHTKGLKCSGGAHKYKQHIDAAIAKLRKGNKNVTCPYSTTDKGNFKTHVERSARRTVEGHDVPGTSFSGGRWQCSFSSKSAAEFLAHTTGLKSARNFEEKYRPKLEAALSDIKSGRLGKCPFSTQQRCRIKGHIESAAKPTVVSDVSLVSTESSGTLDEGSEHSAEVSPTPAVDKDPSEMTREERKVYFAMQAFNRMERDKKRKLQRSKTKSTPTPSAKRARPEAARAPVEVKSTASRPSVPQRVKEERKPKKPRQSKEPKETPSTVKSSSTSTPRPNTQSTLVRKTNEKGHYPSTRTAAPPTLIKLQVPAAPVSKKPQFQVVPVHHHLAYPCMYARHDVPENYDLPTQRAHLHVAPPDPTRLLTEATNELAFQSKFESPASSRHAPRASCVTRPKSEIATPQAVKCEPKPTVPFHERLDMRTAPYPQTALPDESNTRNVAEILQGLYAAV